MRSYLFKLLSLLALVLSGLFSLPAPEEQSLILTKEKLSSLSNSIHPSSEIDDYLESIVQYQDILLYYMAESSSSSNFYYGLKQLTPVLEKLWLDIDFDQVPLSKLSPQYENGLYINSYKTNRTLSKEEREKFFSEEEKIYNAAKTVEVEVLNLENIDALEAEIIYNFVLLPSGDVFFSPENMNRKVYHLRDDGTKESHKLFTHPNHTILAGSPHQEVLTAGAFILYKHEDSRLFFVSNKSGHFAPNYSSLHLFKEQFAEFGVNTNSIILLPDLDLTGKMLKKSPSFPFPIMQNQEQFLKAYSLALNNWKEANENTNMKEILQLIAMDGVVKKETYLKLKEYRKHGLTLMNAYRVFDESHKANKAFKKLLKRLGHFNDVMAHQKPEQIAAGAQKLFFFLEKEEFDLNKMQFTPSSPESFQEKIQESLLAIDESFQEDALSPETFHKLKKNIRCLGNLFKLQSKTYYAYRMSKAAMDLCNEMNDELGLEYDEYIAKVLEKKAGNIDLVIIPQSAKTKYFKLRSHLSRHFDCKLYPAEELESAA
jgi:hypothetical protein